MKKRVSLLALMVALLLLFTACQDTTTATEAAADADSAVKTMTGEELVAQNEGKKKDEVLLIDVRPVEQYEEGHIPHAINIPLADTEASLEKLEPWKTEPVILYCNTGNQSGQAADILVENGFTNVTNAAGVKEFEYDLVTYNDILAVDMLEMIDDPDTVLVDYRPADDYAGGHLDGSMNIEFDTIEENLDKLPQDKNIVIYCNTGTKSAEAAQALDEAGYENVYNTIQGVKEYEFDLAQ